MEAYVGNTLISVGSPQHLWRHVCEQPTYIGITTSATFEGRTVYLIKEVRSPTFVFSKQIEAAARGPCMMQQTWCVEGLSLIHI